MTRKFEKNGESLGEIKQIALNADGKKISIIADQCPIPSIKIPDTKFYIYDVELDVFMDHELSYNRVAVGSYWDLKDERFLGIETEFMKDFS